jgi:translation initiation factor IF-3
LQAAEEKGLDLVEVSGKSDPPVCRIMDYGKYKYQQSKKLHDAKKKQAVIRIKEIKLRPKTEEHDFNFKLKHAIGFLQEGNKVKVTLQYRGREMAFTHMGIELLERFANEVEDIGIVESRPRAEGRTTFMVLAPKKEKQ